LRYAEEIRHRVGIEVVSQPKVDSLERNPVSSRFLLQGERQAGLVFDAGSFLVDACARRMEVV
jgi:hypothetical protein